MYAAARDTEIYIEALLVDEELTDQLWEAWDAEKIDETAAFLVWCLVAGTRTGHTSKFVTNDARIRSNGC